MKTCPFCGSSDFVVVIIDVPDREGTPKAVVCEGCGCHGPWAYCPEDGDLAALTEWDRRTGG